MTSIEKKAKKKKSLSRPKWQSGLQRTQVAFIYFFSTKVFLLFDRTCAILQRQLNRTPIQVLSAPHAQRGRLLEIRFHRDPHEIESS